MQGGRPRRFRTRNENDDSERNARVAICGLLQSKRERQQSDEKNRNRVRDQICSKIISLERSRRCTNRRGNDSLDRERQRRAESGLHYNQGGNRGPVNLGHLHKPRHDDGRSRGDCCSNRVCDRRKVLFVPSPEFHGRNHLPCRFALARSQSFISKEVAGTNSYVAPKNPTLAQ